MNSEIKKVEGKLQKIWREAMKREKNEKSSKREKKPVVPKGLVCDEESVCGNEANKEFGENSSKMVGLSNKVCKKFVMKFQIL